MVSVTVRLYGSLRRYRPSDAGGAPHQPFVAVLPPGATVETLGRALSLPDGLISAAAINDEAVEVTAPLADGDRVALFPPSAGGQG
ncbi:putative Molybdopterin synthase sulfur carrier subunit [Candidatus Promineifilum breve]|uniref:Molybdopterin synthase sulfur carrier subunit n=1 Tax=Candidatus Promineifilum breve TaxID=1806508 RepID=A0A160T0V4_9CHLR|nr:MoaD/ThiS family protein [Candidatus Promineifilum breve]CUS03062.2 putative Molybdopterin synthase sulfur carrier subunit [Candidatus Promineifilum breve]